MTAHPQQFDNVSAVSLANVYFDGKVVSHTIIAADGSKKTLGLIYPGAFKFNTGASERMAITAGACRVKQAGEGRWTPYAAGSAFTVGANSHFEITVDEGICQYICSFIAA